MSPSVRLRPAGPEDCRLIFDWANLPESRAASFFSEPIPWPTHEAWYGRKLADKACRIFIAEDAGGKPAGLIRFEREGEEGIVSITVAPSHRGQGYAPAIIKAGCAAATLPGVSRWVAEIKKGHAASEKAFARAGFELFETFEKNGAAAIRLRLPAAGEVKR